MTEHSSAPWRVRYDRFGRAQSVVGPDHIEATRSLHRIHREHDERLRAATHPDPDELLRDPAIPKTLRADLPPVAQTPGTTWDMRRSANARLISAAPELLGAARAAYRFLGKRAASVPGEGQPKTEEQELLREIARAISKALGEDLDRMSFVDDRAPLHLWPGDRHLPRSRRRYRCKVCNLGVGKAHDSMCAWLREQVERCQALWPHAAHWD